MSGTGASAGGGGGLHGVKVLDLSRLAPGPYCTMLLADMGAEVIVVGGGVGSLPIPVFLRGKKLISLDLKCEEGRRAFHRLAADADVVVEGYRPGVAARLGIARWVAEALPEDKAARIADLSAQGRRVVMVGDGLNDTAALASAHVSISPASALDAARVASDIVLLGRDLTPIAEACQVAKSAVRRIRENFRIATVYNVIAVPLAVAGLATPLIAALAMSTSSITVSLNALRLKG